MFVAYNLNAYKDPATVEQTIELYIACVRQQKVDSPEKNHGSVEYWCVSNSFATIFSTEPWFLGEKVKTKILHWHKDLPGEVSFHF